MAKLCKPCSSSFSFRANHFDQLCCCMFNVMMSVFSGPALCGEQTAAMDVFKIAIRKLVSALCLLRESLVNPEMPFGVFTESMQMDKIILFIWRTPMFAPRAFTVRNEMFLFDELRGECEGGFVQRKALARLSENGVDRTQKNYENDRVGKRMF